MGSNRKSHDRKSRDRRDHVQKRKYVMRMHNRKFHNTPSGTFSPEVTSVTGSDRVRMRNRYILYNY